MCVSFVCVFLCVPGYLFVLHACVYLFVLCVSAYVCFACACLFVLCVPAYLFACACLCLFVCFTSQEVIHQIRMACAALAPTATVIWSVLASYHVTGLIATFNPV